MGDDKGDEERWQVKPAGGDTDKVDEIRIGGGLLGRGGMSEELR